MSGTERRGTPYLEAVVSGDRDDWGYVITADGRVVRVRRVGGRLVADDGSVVGPAVGSADAEQAA